MTAEAKQFDLVVIGLGLAGATLAWQARDLGLDVLIIDDADAAAASRVAAGLVTPVTGARLKPQPGFSDLVSNAARHYRRVAERTGVHAYSERPALRFLTERRELDALDAIETAGNSQVARLECDVPDGIRAAGVPVVMPAAGRLAIADYIDSTRRYFAERGTVIDARVTDDSVIAGADSVAIASLGARATHAVFCRGYRDRGNAHFAALRWRAAKGQILELDCPGFDRRYTVHGLRIWLTAVCENRVLAGATYEWDELDATVTAAARDKLAAAVDALLDVPFTIVNQRAAVRPIVEGRMPVIGRSARSPRIWLMNGLGSKGALFAPTVAKHLVAAIHDSAPVPAAYSLDQRIAAAS
jgi:glycine/D-amino acid oxidase-like deaminating enzyme